MHGKLIILISALRRKERTGRFGFPMMGLVYLTKQGQDSQRRIQSGSNKGLGLGFTSQENHGDARRDRGQRYQPNGAYSYTFKSDDIHETLTQQFQ